ncbi:hypothetical protein L1987_36270 [Smallanthus sonchifolius]|uniref:Uncharacterized protein n=1 Tax=Smallanthus sonchifolius TaxID=185202 RepID=A0ACB9HD36_9ASTR|nr:hypothetical protein L1987_36270 [Smallanthus sonchifolius]
MLQMGFPSRWCDWIYGMLLNTRSSVLVNGSPTFEFQCSKGIRQGDPISPFLFIIIMEALSCLIDKAKFSGDFVGVSTPAGGPVISHLLYADDAMIIGEWSRMNIINVLRILRVFHICSGLKINLAKSNIFSIGVESEELNDMASLLGCKAGIFPFKYLGLMVGANMNRVTNWKPVYDLFDARLAKWKAGLLSIGGRITLIRAVLESLPIYYFSLYRAPVQVINELEAKIRNFLWGGDGNNRKMHWVAWERVSLSKELGGLGISRLKNINIALLAKWGWRFLEDKGKLWTKVIEAIHTTRSGWGFIPARLTMGGVWCNIAKCLSNVHTDGIPLRRFFKSNVGSGKDTMFWIDPWNGNEPLKDVCPNLFKKEANKRCKVSDRIKGNFSGGRYVWEWIQPISVGREVDEMVWLCSSIGGIDLNNENDKWKWIGAAANDFSVAAVKDLLDKNRVASSYYVPEWCKWIPMKCNIFIWRVEMNRIATVEVLKKRNVSVVDQSCCFCGEIVESKEHLFCACPITSLLWTHVCAWCNIPNFFVFSFKDLLEIHDHVGLTGIKKEVVKGIIRIGCWSIWRARNAAKFNNLAVKVEKIISEVKSIGFLWYNVRSKYRNVSWEVWCKFVIM